MVIDSVKVKIQPLAVCDLPYAQMLADKHPVFPEVEPGQGRVALEMRTLKHWAKEMRIEQMAIHFSYNQTYVALKGVMVLVVAPPPRNRDADIADILPVQHPGRDDRRRQHDEQRRGLGGVL